MATWVPDSSFYPSPRLAMKAAPETLAYVAAFDPDRKQPDAILLAFAERVLCVATDRRDAGPVLGIDWGHGHLRG